MANLKQTQSEVVGMIGAAKTLVEKVVSIMTFMTDTPTLVHTFSENPIEYLLDLLKALNITRDELETFLSNFLVVFIPAMEISVKTILLTNLKNMISCTVDPRIPEKYRKKHKSSTDPNTSQEYGIDIDIESIDFLDKLSINPLGDHGKQWYFGLESVEDVYKLARADDFDAFLWFVIHKGKFPSPSLINNTSDLGNVIPSDSSLLNVLEVVHTSGDPSTILLGNTFAYSSANDSHIISMCIDTKYDEAGNIVHNTLVPVSDDWSSVNWYARRADQLGKNLGFGWFVDYDEDDGNKYKYKYQGNPRNFNKERALCNLQYIDQASSTSPLNGLVNNKIRFTILPKPIVHVPNIEIGEPPWRFKKLLFNEKGEYDPNGKYTLVNKNFDNKTDIKYNVGDSSIIIDPISGKVDVSNPKGLVKQLIECYKGLTVFEFNYDYVMSIRLFDAKVIMHTLIETIFNRNYSIELGINHIHEEGTETIKEIIKNILESDDSEINDCYYTFDNSKYESLLRKSEEKRARQYRFGETTREIGSLDEVDEILAEYDGNAELHERIDILKRAITQASVTVSEGAEGEDKYGIQFAFIEDMITVLVTAIVNSLLTPKVLMLLEINQQLMGGTWEKFTFKELFDGLKRIIIDIVTELKNMVIQELLKLIIMKLQPILEILSGLIIKEQMDDYSRVLREITVNCPFIWFKFGGNREETKLDTVDYADIDASTNNGGEQPSTNKC